jgi:hypothetical protein
MAVVKANFVKSGAGEKGRAKATIRYIADRPGKDKEKTARELFGPDGKLTKEQARRMIDEAAKGTLFYRLIISPDPRREDSHKDLNLSELTIQTIAELEDRLKTSIQFAAVVHDDHAPHRHIHVLALLSKKLSRADINFLRVKATAASQLQRRILDLKQERSLAAGHKPARQKTPPLSRGVRPTSTKSSLYAPAPSKIRQSCPSCSEGYSMPMRKIARDLHKCTFCGIVVRQSGLGMQIEPNTRPVLSLSDIT